MQDPMPNNPYGVDICRRNLLDPFSNGSISIEEREEVIVVVGDKMVYDPQHHSEHQNVGEEDQEIDFEIVKFHVA
jgi:hypothetical protein